MSDWQAHIVDDYHAAALDCVRVVFHRPTYDNRREVVTGFTEEGQYITETVEPLHESPFRGFCIPWPAAAAFVERMAPGPSKAELARVQEALDLERRRVDDVLSRTVPGSRS